MAGWPLAQGFGRRYSSLLLVLAASASACPACPPVPLLTVSLNFLTLFVIRSLTDLNSDPPGEAALGRLTAALRLGRERLPCAELLGGRRDPVADRLEHRPTRGGGLGVVGRRVEAGPDEASLRGARSEDIVVLLPVELNGVAMVIPVPGWLKVRSSTPSAPPMANGPSGGAVWEPARTVFPLPKPVNATLPPIRCRMFAVGSGLLAAMTMLSSPKKLVPLLRMPSAATAFRSPPILNTLLRRPFAWTLFESPRFTARLK